MKLSTHEFVFRLYTSIHLFMLLKSGYLVYPVKGTCMTFDTAQVAPVPESGASAPRVQFQVATHDINVTQHRHLISNVPPPPKQHNLASTHHGRQIGPGLVRGGGTSSAVGINSVVSIPPKQQQGVEVAVSCHGTLLDMPKIRRPAHHVNPLCVRVEPQTRVRAVRESIVPMGHINPPGPRAGRGRVAR